MSLLLQSQGCAAGLLQADAVRSAEQLAANIDSQNEAVVDARSPGRFDGSAPEPRPGIPSGHIPGSRNVPFSSVLTKDGRCVLVEAQRQLSCIF